VAPVSGTTETRLLRVGGRLFGRAWYNTSFGGASGP